MSRLLTKKITACKSNHLPAHAHRHEWHDKVVVKEINRNHCFCVKIFIISRLSGIRFWHRSPKTEDWLPGFRRA